MNHQTVIPGKKEQTINQAFASNFAKSMFLTILGLFILTFIGTRMFTHIDLNLYGYMVGTIVFIGGFFYRFIAWGERDDNGMYNIIMIGVNVLTVPADGIIANLSYNALNITAIYHDSFY